MAMFKAEGSGLRTYIPKVTCSHANVVGRIAEYEMLPLCLDLYL